MKITNNIELQIFVSNFIENIGYCSRCFNPIDMIYAWHFTNVVWKLSLNYYSKLQFIIHSLLFLFNFLRIVCFFFIGSIAWISTLGNDKIFYLLDCCMDNFFFGIPISLFLVCLTIWVSFNDIVPHSFCSSHSTDF